MSEDGLARYVECSVIMAAHPQDSRRYYIVVIKAPLEATQFSVVLLRQRIAVTVPSRL
jgi:hypothetical protein